MKIINKLTNKQFEKLSPFLFRKASRQRIILYLVALGYSVSDMRKMKVGELKKITMHKDLEAARDEIIFELSEADHVFVLPNGNIMAHTTFYRLFRDVGKKVLGHPLSQEKLNEYIKKE